MALPIYPSDPALVVDTIGRYQIHPWRQLHQIVQVLHPHAFTLQKVMVEAVSSSGAAHYLASIVYGVCRTPLPSQGAQVLYAAGSIPGKSVPALVVNPGRALREVLDMDAQEFREELERRGWRFLKAVQGWRIYDSSGEEVAVVEDFTPVGPVPGPEPPYQFPST